MIHKYILMSKELGCQCINGDVVFAEERPENELSQIWDQSDLQQNSLSSSNPLERMNGKTTEVNNLLQGLRRTRHVNDRLWPTVCVGVMFQVKQ